MRPKLLEILTLDSTCLSCGGKVVTGEGRMSERKAECFEDETFLVLRPLPSPVVCCCAI